MSPALSTSTAHASTMHPPGSRADSKFWDRLATRYAKRPVADQASYETKLEKTRRHFKPDMKLLEFGCGTGSTAIIHAPRVQHIHAIDISEKMLQIARERTAAAQITNIHYERATLDELDVPAASYDMILGMSILHLLEDREAALRRVHELLVPGGLFVSSTSCIDDTFNLFKCAAALGRWLRLIPLVRVFSSEQLCSSLVATGFSIEDRWQPGPGKDLFVVARRV